MMSFQACKNNDTYQAGLNYVFSSLPKIFILTILLTIHALSVRANDFVVLQSTTSVQNSGLYEVILPAFRQKTGIQVKVVAVGTGQALKNAERCDGDVVLVHSKADEQAFVEAGFGLERFDVMHNDFVLIGPQTDPAQISAAVDVGMALKAVESHKSLFLSRGDESGTHKAERRLWQQIGLDTRDFNKSWYRESGQGMGSTLHLAVQMHAYTLSDRGTWLAFASKDTHKILFSGDPVLFNPYGVIAVSPAHCPSANHQGALRFIDWILSTEGQDAIQHFQIDGQSLFFANAR